VVMVALSQLANSSASEKIGGVTSTASLAMTEVLSDLITSGIFSTESSYSKADTDSIVSDLNVAVTIDMVPGEDALYVVSKEVAFAHQVTSPELVLREDGVSFEVEMASGVDEDIVSSVTPKFSLPRSVFDGLSVKQLIHMRLYRRLRQD